MTLSDSRIEAKGKALEASLGKREAKTKSDSIVHKRDALSIKDAQTVPKAEAAVRTWVRAEM